jgi:hypothetical protein
MDEDGGHGGLASHPELTTNGRESEEHTGREEYKEEYNKEHLYNIPTNFSDSYELIGRSELYRERVISGGVGLCALGVACYYVYMRLKH